MKRKKWLIDQNGRECRHCEKYLLWENFDKNAGNSTGYANLCKKCHSVAYNKRAKTIARAKERCKTDIGFRLRERIRCRTRAAWKNQGNYIKPGSFTESLGCSNQEYKQYLESKFQPGMTWDNYGHGSDKWNIDHIKPLSKFDLSDPIQFKEACHYTNTQPMWQPENFKKKAKVDF